MISIGDSVVKFIACIFLVSSLLVFSMNSLIYFIIDFCHVQNLKDSQNFLCKYTLFFTYKENSLFTHLIFFNWQIEYGKAFLFPWGFQFQKMFSYKFNNFISVFVNASRKFYNVSIFFDYPNLFMFLFIYLKFIYNAH